MVEDHPVIVQHFGSIIFFKSPPLAETTVIGVADIVTNPLVPNNSCSSGTAHRFIVNIAGKVG